MPLRASSLLCLSAAALLAVLAAPSATADGADLVITIDAQGHAHVAGPGLVLRHESPAENYTLDITLGKSYTIAEVRVQGGVDVARPRQLVPEIDDSAQHPREDHLHPHFFSHVSRDVSDADAPAHVVNFTGLGDTFTTRLGLVGPGSSVLTLTRDVEAPFYQMNGTTDVTHYSFVAATRTDEFAYGALRVRPSAGGEPVPFPTSVPSLWQTFPVQGLDANTTYVYDVVLTDWAGNAVTTEETIVHTLARPRATPYVLMSQEPAPDSTAVPGDRVAATFGGEALTDDRVRFFLDKAPTVDGVDVNLGGGTHNLGWTVTYSPGVPAESGRHTVSFEVTNTAGERTVAQWSFIVEGDAVAAPSMPWPAVAIASLGLAALLRRP